MTMQGEPVDEDEEEWSFSSTITERMARFGLEGQQSSTEAKKADMEKDRRPGGGAPTLRSLGCVLRRTRRYNPDDGAPPPPRKAHAATKAEVDQDDQEEECHDDKVEGRDGGAREGDGKAATDLRAAQPHKASVPFLGVQFVGGESLTMGQILTQLRRSATKAATSSSSTPPPSEPQSAPGTPSRPAWDSTIGGTRASVKEGGGAQRGNVGCGVDDVSAVRVCGVGGGISSVASLPGCAPQDPDAGNGGGAIGGCGGRIRDIASTAMPLRPPGGRGGEGDISHEGEDGKGGGEAEGRSPLRRLLERVSSKTPGKEPDGARQCLISRFEPSGGRLFVCDRVRAASKGWLEQSDLMQGRAVRCLRKQAAFGEYPQMRHAWYEVDDVLNEPILGYHTDEEGCLLEVAGLRRLQVKQVMSYIHEGISCGEGVVVHCRAGANRSATVAAAYMMIYHRFTCEDALRLIELRGPTRHVVRQPGFTRQLMLLESELASARASKDARRWEDLPGEWNNTLYAVEGRAPAGSNFLASRLREQLLGGGPSLAGGANGGANGAVGAPFERRGNATAPGDMCALDEEDETDAAAAATGYEPHAVVLPAVLSPASSPPSQSQPAPASAPVGVELYGGGGHVMSCMGEVLEGQIWHSKLLSIETGRGEDAGDGVLCVAPPPLSNGDSTVTDQVVSLKGAAVEGVGEKECEIRPAGKSALRITLRSKAERDEFVSAAGEMAMREGMEGEGEGEGEGAWGCAAKAHLVVNEDDDEEEVWM